MSSTLPDFLVVGGMKAGTTTLKHYLRQHPSIFMYHTEIHFFEKDDVYSEGLDWYTGHFAEAPADSVVGEKTPGYGYSRDAMRRIAQDVPGVKIVWIFRNPVDRAYSNYWHAVNSGEERAGFEEAVHRELDTQSQPWELRYCMRSRYVEHVRTYLELFRHEDMCVLYLEELNADPESELGRLYDFLGVERQLPPDMEPKHRTRIPKSIGVQRFLRRVVRRVIGRRAYRKIKRLNQRALHGYPDLDPELRARLVEYFRPYNEELFELVGRRARGWDG